MSKKIFSAQEWETVPFEQTAQEQAPPIYNKVQKPIRHNECNNVSDLEEELDCVVSEIEARGIDLTSDYGDWVKLGFALVDGLGEQGRGYYHRLSSFYPGYTLEEANKQYDLCLNSHGSGITIRTFFHLAEQAGVPLGRGMSEYPKCQNGFLAQSGMDNTEIPKCQNGFLAQSGMDNTEIPKCQNGFLDKWIKEEGELPSLPDEVYDNLPSFLREVVDNAISPGDRDVILLGAFVCLSSCLTNICGVYDERIVYPNLYLFVVADAGMGKGTLTLCRELVVPINRKLHELSRRLEEEYKTALAEYGKDKKNFTGMAPTEPPMRMLIIPANSSASSFLKILADNNGAGLLFETEGDTLSQTLKADYGNYSDVLRKAFHHEPISLSRRKDREYCEVNTPCLSVALAGTPEQVGRLIPDAENGLMSRFIFYIIRFRRNIRNVFATSDVSQSKSTIFKILGDKFCHRQEEFAKRGTFTFSLPDDLQHDFIAHLAQVNEECCEEVDNRVQGIVRRTGLIAFRMMMLLTAIREMESATYNTNHPDPGSDINAERQNTSVHLLCRKADYDTSFLICDTLLYHAVYIYRKLSNAKNRMTDYNTTTPGVAAHRNRLYNLLPDTFTRQEYDEIATAAGECINTAVKWIGVFIKSGMLRRMEQGRYCKI